MSNVYGEICVEATLNPEFFVPKLEAVYACTPRISYFKRSAVGQISLPM
jgi:hypothetical protein